jgi:hypothetical protein
MVGRIVVIVLPLALVAACQPVQDASTHKSASSFCPRTYEPSGESLVDVTLHVEDKMSDLKFEGLCVRLDNGAVLITRDEDNASGYAATRRIRVPRGNHSLVLDGIWVAADTHAFEVHSAHRLTVDGEMAVSATENEDAAGRPRIDWHDERPQPTIDALLMR